MFEFFKRMREELFGKTFPLGALRSPIDTRDISLASFQVDVALPTSYETNLTAVRDQGAKPKCVASAICEVGELYFYRKGVLVELSDDDLYEQCKTIDGIPDIAGTYPSVGAYVACKKGIATVFAYGTKDQAIIEASRAKYRFGGYAFVSNNYHSICQAIYQNGAITASVEVDTNWFIGIITRVLKSLGRHYIIFKGYSTDLQLVLKGRNSWGIGWIGQIAGMVNPSIKPGEFEVLYSDIADTLYDIISFTDIPKELLEEVKTKKYKFMFNLSIGSQSTEVRELQKRLTEEGVYTGPITGYFGPLTKEAVIRYQIKNNIDPIGVVGPMTRKSLNMDEVDKIDLFCLAIQQHEGYYEGSRSFRNKNPGNLKYVGQTGSTGKDSGDFAIFKTYEDGFKALKEMIIRACTGKSSIYYPEMTILQFFQKYAPSSDNNNPLQYSEAVAKKVGVSIDTKIKSLI